MKIQQCFLELQLKMSGMFFLRHTVYIRDRISVTITNRKSHADFRLIPTSITLNERDRRNSLYFAFSPNPIALLSITSVVEDRRIMSVNIVFQFQSSTFGYN